MTLPLDETREAAHDACMTSTYDAYEMHQHDKASYSVTLVNTVTGARHQSNQVACGWQAAAQVHRGNRLATRKTFLGVTKMSQGQRVATVLPAECNLTDPLHTHTHVWALPEVEES